MSCNGETGMAVMQKPAELLERRVWTNSLQTLDTMWADLTKEL